ncbi:MAG: winged helix-turn-helix transcriptional regulator [Pseudomonadales bacterium]|nr:winged helix-turn-helix transcriptional regulator [Pseudomonadales bacterium]MCP5183900.1 winged helix-turn-helix transcriptional regulator [Pseudomonadales bacterium]
MARSRIDNQGGEELFLLAGLTRAVDWIDNSLQHVLASRGFQPVHRTQSLILVHIASGVDSPTDIALEMGLTRQNVHQMARGLIDAGIVEQFPDPRDPRRSRYRLTASSVAVRTAALETLSALEAVIARRTGSSAGDMRILRRVLAADWGPAISSAQALDKALDE